MIDQLIRKVSTRPLVRMTYTIYISRSTTKLKRNDSSSTNFVLLSLRVHRNCILNQTLPHINTVSSRLSLIRVEAIFQEIFRLKIHIRNHHIHENKKKMIFEMNYCKKRSTRLIRSISAKPRTFLAYMTQVMSHNNISNPFECESKHASWSFGKVLDERL